jgi:hypothetical protein
VVPLGYDDEEDALAEFLASNVGWIDAINISI